MNWDEVNEMSWDELRAGLMKRRLVLPEGMTRRFLSAGRIFYCSCDPTKPLCGYAPGCKAVAADITDVDG